MWPAAATVTVSVSMSVLLQMTGGLRGNWDAFWEAVSRDHCHAGLLWNEGSRGELRDALEREEMGLRAMRGRLNDAGGSVSWNYHEFGVEYASLGRQLCIGGVYIKLLLEGLDTGACM